MGSDNLLHNFGDVQEIRNGCVVLKSIAVQGRFLNQGANVSRHKLTLYWLLKVYKVAVRPAMLHGLETVALTKRQEAEMEVAELKMLRFSLGVTRMDKIRNEYIRGTAQVGKFGEKTREARLRWYGHLRRKMMGILGEGC